MLVVLYLAAAVRLRQQSRKIRPGNVPAIAMQSARQHDDASNIATAESAHISGQQADTTLSTANQRILRAVPLTERIFDKRNKRLTKKERRQMARSHKNASRSALHIKVFRLYTVISFTFALFFSFLPLSYFGISWLVYGYFLNYITNPVIYNVFVDKFREQVRDIIQKLRHRCSCYRRV